MCKRGYVFPSNLRTLKTTYTYGPAMWFMRVYGAYASLGCVFVWLLWYKICEPLAGGMTEDQTNDQYFYPLL